MQEMQCLVLQPLQSQMLSKRRKSSTTSMLGAVQPIFLPAEHWC